MIVLARFENDHARRGYGVEREWYFVESLIEQPDERTYIDSSLLERLHEIESESIEFHDKEDTWYYALDCILGELSGQLFPATAEESARWETDRHFWQAEAERTTSRTPDIEPLPTCPTLQEA